MHMHSVCIVCMCTCVMCVAFVCVYIRMSNFITQNGYYVPLGRVQRSPPSVSEQAAPKYCSSTHPHTSSTTALAGSLDPDMNMTHRTIHMDTKNHDHCRYLQESYKPTSYKARSTSNKSTL